MIGINERLMDGRCVRSIATNEPVDRPTEDLVQQRLWEMLNFAVYKSEIVHRSNDLQRLLKRTQNEISTLTDIANIEDRIDLEEVFGRVDKVAFLKSLLYSLSQRIHTLHRKDIMSLTFEDL